MLTSPADTVPGFFWTANPPEDTDMEGGCMDPESCYAYCCAYLVSIYCSQSYIAPVYAQDAVRAGIIFA